MRDRVFPPPWLTGTRGVWAPLGEPLPKVPPFLIEDLLDDLGLPRDTPRAQRDAAITAWLAGNEPCLGLVLDLEADGYYRRRAGSREAGRTAAESAKRAAWERAVAAGLVD